MARSGSMSLRRCGVVRSCHVPSLEDLLHLEGIDLGLRAAGPGEHGAVEGKEKARAHLGYARRAGPAPSSPRRRAAPSKWWSRKGWVSSSRRPQISSRTTMRRQREGRLLQLTPELGQARQQDLDPRAPIEVALRQGPHLVERLLGKAVGLVEPDQHLLRLVGEGLAAADRRSRRGTCSCVREGSRPPPSRGPRHPGAAPRRSRAPGGACGRVPGGAAAAAPSCPHPVSPVRSA